ncbi:MAG: threonine synthase [Calditrichaceae bacterium]|jgi:threonine synthase
MDHKKIAYLRCVNCKKQYAAEDVQYTCPNCGSLRGTLDVVYNYKYVKKHLTKEQLQRSNEYSHWRYLPILPVYEEQYIQPLKVGWSPLYHHKRLNSKLKLPLLFLKDDSGNITSSYKDRASSVAIVKALEGRYEGIGAASSGNAGASIAAFAASAGLPCYIFVPETIPKPKLAQLQAYGAQTMLVKGTYDDAFDLCMKECDKNHWFNRNTAINPYLAEGKKTGALEICEQLNWDVPDIVFVPVGDGCILSGIWKGFKDLREIGFIDRFPQLIGVQAEGSAPLVEAYQKGLQEACGKSVSTIADSICVGYPRDQVKALRAIHQSGGTFISVNDDSIVKAIRFLSENSGIFVEPAAATAFAGMQFMLNKDKIESKQKIVVMLTGSGLKDIRPIL